MQPLIGSRAARLLIDHDLYGFPLLCRFCPAHETDGTPRCTACTRLQLHGAKFTAGGGVRSYHLLPHAPQQTEHLQCWQPSLEAVLTGLLTSIPHRHISMTLVRNAGEEWVAVDKDRYSCLGCLATMVRNTADCQPLYDDVLLLYASFGMPLPTRPPLLLVRPHLLGLCCRCNAVTGRLFWHAAAHAPAAAAGAVLSAFWRGWRTPCAVWSSATGCRACALGLARPMIAHLLSSCNRWRRRQ